MRRLVVAATLFAFVIVGATAGYMLIEGASFLDAVYMTVISISTVGFSETIDLDAAGRWLTMAVILLGIGTFTYAAGTALEFLVEGHLARLVEGRRMERKISALRDHVVVCGFGRVGRAAAQQLVEEGRAVCVVDPDPERLALASDDDLVVIEGDAGESEVLEGAGLERAGGLVAATNDDAENMLITITAKSVKPDLLVVARVSQIENGAKLRRVGADHVIAPSEIGGHRMAALLAKPHVADFLEVVNHTQRLDLALEEALLADDSPLVGLTLRDLQVRERYGVTVLAVAHPDGGPVSTHVQPDDRLCAGDTLILIGSRPDLRRLLDEAET